MIDTNVVETIRSKYMFEMKKSVTSIYKLIDVNYNGNVDTLINDIDTCLGKFTESKEKAKHFEDILKVMVEQNKNTGSDGN